MADQEKSPSTQPQQRLDQDAKTLPATFEGRDGQAPVQEFLQQPKKQHDDTRVQRTHNEDLNTIIQKK